MDIGNRIWIYYCRTICYLNRKKRRFITIHRKRSLCGISDVLSYPLKYQSYNGSVSTHDRFLMVGFDDFRHTDITWVMPLFEKYGYATTFNGIATGNYRERLFVARAQKKGHEIGDHTFFHEQYPYFSPLYNGYDPNHPDGSNQQPYPSNEDMRCDRGDGCNAFGFPLNSRVDYLNHFHDSSVANHSILAFESPIVEQPDITWAELTDEHCQRIRNHYSLICDDKLCCFLDELSAEFLGTHGYSKGSFDIVKGCYSRGIFTNCTTSTNHVVWERIMYLQRCYQRKYNHVKYDCITWSRPGAKCGDLFYEHHGIKYYDKAHTMPVNILSKIPNEWAVCAGEGGIRSFKSILMQYGYRVAHDIRYPSMLDGYEKPEMSHIMIFNASCSKLDALAYYSDRTLPNENIKTSVESLRHRMASGAVANAIVDSGNDEDQIALWKGILEYCSRTGVKVITKAQAYDICFNRRLETGNLIYNPTFRNTLKEFMPDTVETNPDGYVGKCRVVKNENIPTLETMGETKYSHYGIPIGKISYSVAVKGYGMIRIYLLRNRTKINTEEEILAQIDIHSEQFENKKIFMSISDEPLSMYECQFEGWGEKVCGLRIVYSCGLKIRNIQLSKMSNRKV